MTGYIVDIFVGLLLAVAVLALVARTVPHSLSHFFRHRRIVDWLGSRIAQGPARSGTGFPFLPAAAPVSSGTVHLVARFPRQPPSHFAARHRARPLHHGGRRLAGVPFLSSAARGRVCSGCHHFPARRHRRHGDCRTAESSAPHRHRFWKAKAWSTMQPP